MAQIDEIITKRLLAIFRNTQSEEIIQHALQAYPSGILSAHLSPMRWNLLSWYPFDPSRLLLEVEAGVGALIGLFCRKVSSVVAQEASAGKFLVLQERHATHNNLQLANCSLSKLVWQQKFSYVTCLGAFENAKKIFSDPKPHLKLLTHLKSFLIEGGHLLLTVQNRFGLKHWSGVSKTGAQKTFLALERYFNNDETYLFGKAELEILFRQAGFKEIKFYYPLPNFLLPQEIFSDEFLPTAKHGVSELEGSFSLVRMLHQENFLNTKLVTDLLARNGYLDIFADSFLIDVC